MEIKKNNNLTVKTIEPFIHRKIVVLHTDQTALQAARAMCDKKVGSVIVADREGHVVGIVTDRDLVCSQLATEMSVDVPLLEVMTEGVFCVNESAEISDVVNLMKEYGIRRVPVVEVTANEKQKCIGLVSLDDLIASQAIDYESLSQIVQSQVQRFRKVHPRAREDKDTLSDQTLNRFSKLMAGYLGIEDKTESLRIAYYFLSQLVRRMHYTASGHFISQLPSQIQSDLFDLEAGPDASITLDSVLEQAGQMFSVSTKEAEGLFKNFWNALMDFTNNDLRFVWVHLPKEFQEALQDEESTMTIFSETWKSKDVRIDDFYSSFH